MMHNTTGIVLATALMAACLVPAAGMAPAGESFDFAQGRPAKAEGPLAGLPSQPGPHIEKIRALGEDQWLDLGAPAADPKWGEACGRSWTPFMPPAPELRGAFLHSMGPHGFVKLDGHILANDLWFYDLNAHFCYMAADGHPGPMFVYRYRRGAVNKNSPR